MLTEEHKRLLAADQWAIDRPINRVDIEDTAITPNIARETGYTNEFGASGSAPDRRRVNQIICEAQGAAITARTGIPQYDAEIDYPVGALASIKTLIYLAVRANGPSTEAQHPQQEGQVSWQALPGATRTPSEPRDFDFDNSKPKAITIRWKPGRDNGSEITGYDIQYKSSTTNVWVPSTPLRVEFPIIDLAGLAGGVKYNIRARCVSLVGTSGWVETQAETQNGVALPNPPNAITGDRPAGGLSIGLEATAGVEEVRLKWVKPDDGGYPILGYLVEWRTAGGSFTPSNSRVVNSIGYVVENLVARREYEFQVSARNAVGAGVPSNIASATPKADTTPIEQPRLLAPTLSPFPVGDLTATARWEPVENAITAPIQSYDWQIDQVSDNWASPITQTARHFTLTGHFSYGTRVMGRFRVTTTQGTTDWSPIGYATIGGERPEPPTSGTMVLSRLGDGSYRAVINVGNSANNNGSPITDYSYRVVCEEGGTLGSGSTQSFVSTSDAFRRNRGTVCRLLCAVRNRFGWSYWREFGSYNIPF